MVRQRPSNYKRPIRPKPGRKNRQEWKQGNKDIAANYENGKGQKGEIGLRRVHPIQKLRLSTC